jgi:hypothetical protein
MASGKGNTNAIGILKLIYQAVNFANLADNTVTSPLTNLYVSLHTANPGATGNQQTSEAAYSGYGRVAVARTSGGWSISGETISNVAAINFPSSSSGPEVETYVGVGTTTTGNAGVLLWFGQLTASLTVNNGITPSIAVGALTITEA